ncbi:hypothetical protein MCA2225 [Methylococcus capsulatus str. Bath]|uniref:Uncharacterized protein n=1 Tax=Methylococcus capsulatus (strain ATCC 33009 / NCIMB 11132 / Bath) TaxID=243233 RepID=Q605Q4_METCA|nr:hypothetical protein MCA2225 [Methylococcus capsulatus str. Bath]
MPPAAGRRGRARPRQPPRSEPVRQVVVDHRHAAVVQRQAGRMAVGQDRIVGIELAIRRRGVARRGHREITALAEGMRVGGVVLGGQAGAAGIGCDLLDDLQLVAGRTVVGGFAPLIGIFRPIHVVAACRVGERGCNAVDGDETVVVFEVGIAFGALYTDGPGLDSGRIGFAVVGALIEIIQAGVDIPRARVQDHDRSCQRIGGGSGTQCAVGAGCIEEIGIGGGLGTRSVDPAADIDLVVRDRSVGVLGQVAFRLAVLVDDFDFAPFADVAGEQAGDLILSQAGHAALGVLPFAVRVQGTHVDLGALQGVAQRFGHRRVENQGAAGDHVQALADLRGIHRSHAIRRVHAPEHRGIDVGDAGVGHLLREVAGLGDPAQPVTARRILLAVAVVDHHGVDRLFVEHRAHTLRRTAGGALVEQYFGIVDGKPRHFGRIDLAEDSRVCGTGVGGVRVVEIDIERSSHAEFFEQLPDIAILGRCAGHEDFDVGRYAGFQCPALSAESQRACRDRCSDFLDLHELTPVCLRVIG